MLNDAGLRLKDKLDPGELQGLDDFFEAWRKADSLRRFGKWLRTEHSDEFKTRYLYWKNK